MKLIAYTILLLALPFAAIAEDTHFSLGVSATMAHETSSEAGASVDKYAVDNVAVFAIFPLDAVWETDVGVVFAYQSISDVTQAGLSGQLGFLASLVKAGPFAVKSGFSGQLGFLGAPDGSTGNASQFLGSLTVPLVFDIGLGDKWAIRITQPVIAARFNIEGAGSSSFQGSVFVNTGFTPNVGVDYSF